MSGHSFYKSFSFGALGYCRNFKSSLIRALFTVGFLNYIGRNSILKQLGFRFDVDADLEGIWDSIPIEHQQEFIRVHSELVVKVTKNQPPVNSEHENE